MLLDIQKVMCKYEVSRATATMLLQDCPYTLPRKTGGKYYVEADAFDEWLRSGGKESGTVDR